MFKSPFEASRKVGLDDWLSTTHPTDASNILSEAIKAEYPMKKYQQTNLGNKYVSPLGKSFEGEKVSPNKVSIAKRIATMEYEFESMLNSKLRKLVKAIQEANGLTD